jgi:hypothetical protein
LMLRASLFTQKVPSARDGQDSRQALLFQVKAPSGRDQAAPCASRKTWSGALRQTAVDRRVKARHVAAEHVKPVNTADRDARLGTRAGGRAGYAYAGFAGGQVGVQAPAGAWAGKVSQPRPPRSRRAHCLAGGGNGVVGGAWVMVS